MILYIGNKLLKHGKTPSCIDTLGPQLSLDYDIKLVSDKMNKFLRFFDIVINIIKYRNKVKLILIDTYSTSNFYFALVASSLAKMFNIKYIPILHGGDLPKRLKLSPILSKMIFFNSKINISPSKYLQEEFKKNGYKVEYIPNNIDLSKYSFKIREKIKPKLLYVRAFHKIYNPSMAVKVLYDLLQTYPEAELCMVGPDKDGSLGDVKKLAKELGVFKKIKFTGKLSKDEWIELSVDYDVFINTTNFDNQPVSIIEAMALGFPIVSTNVGGLPYLIEDGENGILVDKGNNKAMTDKIIYLLENDFFVKKLSLASLETSKEFDWKNVKKMWGKVIND